MTNKLIFRKIGFSSHDAQQIEEDLLTNHPIVYILYNQHSLQAYVGETVQFKRRLKKHLGNPQRKALSKPYLLDISDSTSLRPIILRLI